MTGRIIAIANAAGSAGKTTTVVSLAALCAARGQRVLVVDADAQANATRWLGIDPSEVKFNTADVLLRRIPLAEAVTASPLEEGRITVLAGGVGLDDVPVLLTATTGGEQRLRLALAAADADIVLIDCPGFISVITIAAFVAAQGVLTVTQPTLKESDGISDLIATVDVVREAYNPTLEFCGIVPCMVPGVGGGRIYSDVLALLTHTYGDLVSPSVRRAAMVPESYTHGEPPPLYQPRHKVTTDYEAVLDWFLPSAQEVHA
jgi:chromosome partitioning protein